MQKPRDPKSDGLGYNRPWATIGFPPQAWWPKCGGTIIR